MDDGGEVEEVERADTSERLESWADGIDSTEAADALRC
jgi:hypothetical protein